MSFLTLFCGLLLPWFCGFVWLAWYQARFGRNRGLRATGLAGYGFFLGYAVLHAIVLASSALAGTVSFGVTMGSMALLTGLGVTLALFHRQRLSDTPKPSPRVAVIERYGPGGKFLFTLLVAWIALHLLVSAIELLTMPIYPWDAWDTWIYRGKAWFHAGQVLDMVSARGWAATTDPSVYAITAHDYPMLASVVPFWAAVSFGAWSETLVNLPVLFCGLALGMALWGQARALGLDPLSALVLCYLLFATPLIGVHLSLGGYADIWMAGFAGLGFIALLHGLISRDGAHLLLGLFMVALGMLVKNEGVVWLYAALLLLLLTSLPSRTLLAILGSLLVVTIITMALDVSYVELPLVGGLGLAEGRFHLPLVGSFALEINNVWREYLSNLFTMGNWNLVWVLVLISLVIAALPPYSREQRLAVLFVAIFATTQAFIFVFTEQGQFAARYTAINRLPLQFLPALFYAAAMIMVAQISGRGSNHEQQEARHD